MSIWSRIEQRLTDLADEILPDDYKDQLVGAQKLIEQGRAAEGATLATRLLRQRPEHPETLCLLGDAQLQLKQASDALENFERALKTKPDLATALVGKGAANAALGHLEEAETTLRRGVLAAAGDPSKLAVAYRELGKMHLEQGSLEKSIRELRKAVVEAPKNLRARALLGRALAAHPTASNHDAQKHLEIALKAPAPSAETRLAMAGLARQSGDYDQATKYYGAVLAESPGESSKLQALLGLGAVCEANDNHPGARDRYLEAVRESPDSQTAALHLGDVYKQLGADREAMAEYARFAEQSAEAAQRALEIAMGLRDWQATQTFADALANLAPDHSRLAIAQAMLAAEAGDYTRADGLLEKASDAPSWQQSVVAADIALRRTTDREGARVAAHRALAALTEFPEAPGAMHLLERARTALYPATAQPSVVGLVENLQALNAEYPATAVTFAQAQNTVAHLDAPLLVTVMGEFSSGKSSFINAFIGEDVAPTGILPTTATINVVKYGRVRGGRVCWRGGRIESVTWDALFERLGSLTEQVAEQIETVEVLIPREDLQQVNLVDTPGLNSTRPEHEQVTRKFIRQADAVIWLFAAGQAGKASERDALREISKAGKRVLGVMNKIDQLGAGQAEEAQQFLSKELEGLVEVIVPFSATQARNPSGGKDGNRNQLTRELEERFFTRARELKLEAARRVLSEFIHEATQLTEARHDTLVRAKREIEHHQEALERRKRALQDRELADIRKGLLESTAKLYRQAAQEVLELVQPRRLPFGSHGATRADRDYLVSVLDDGYEAVLSKARTELRSLLRQTVLGDGSSFGAAATVLPIDPGQRLHHLLEEDFALLDADIFGRGQSYLRGFLRGGYVDAFIRRDLPKLELTEDAVYHALFRDAPNLDRAMAPHLLGLFRRAIERAENCLRTAHRTTEILLEDLERGVGAALAQAAIDVKTAT